MKKIVVVFSLFCLVLACKPKEKVAQTSVKNLNKADYFSLTRGACYGTCPIYKMTINGNGTFTYFGKSHVKRIGAYKGKLSQEETLAIFNKLNSYAWAKYQDEYPMDNTDFPQFVVEYKQNELFKQIKGNSNAPKELLEFNASIDKLIDNVAMEKLM